MFLNGYGTWIMQKLLKARKGATEAVRLSHMLHSVPMLVFLQFAKDSDKLKKQNILLICVLSIMLFCQDTD